MLKHPEKPGVMDAANQIGFFKIIAVPLVNAWFEVFRIAGTSLVRQAQSNMQRWSLLKTAGAPVTLHKKRSIKRIISFSSGEYVNILTNDGDDATLPGAYTRDDSFPDMLHVEPGI